MVWRARLRVRVSGEWSACIYAWWAVACAAAGLGRVERMGRFVCRDGQSEMSSEGQRKPGVACECEFVNF